MWKGWKCIDYTWQQVWWSYAWMTSNLHVGHWQMVWFQKMYLLRLSTDNEVLGKALVSPVTALAQLSALHVARSWSTFPIAEPKRAKRATDWSFIFSNDCKMLLKVSAFRGGPKRIVVIWRHFSTRVNLSYLSSQVFVLLVFIWPLDLHHSSAFSITSDVSGSFPIIAAGAPFLLSVPRINNKSEDIFKRYLKLEPIPTNLDSRCLPSRYDDLCRSWWLGYSNNRVKVHQESSLPRGNCQVVTEIWKMLITAHECVEGDTTGWNRNL